MRHAPDKRFWAEITERAVWSNSVVVLPPGLDSLSGFVQAAKPVLIQAFVPQPAIEALDVRVLDRLARLDEVQLHPLRVYRREKGARHLFIQ